MTSAIKVTGLYQIARLQDSKLRTSGKIIDTFDDNGNPDAFQVHHSQTSRPKTGFKEVLKDVHAKNRKHWTACLQSTPKGR